MNKFGSKFRKERSAAKKTLGNTARHIGFSIPYLSDIERGRRKPLSNDVIKAACEFFEIEPYELLALAAEDRDPDIIELAPSSARHKEVGTALMRRFPHMTNKELEKIEKVLEEDKE